MTTALNYFSIPPLLTTLAVLIISVFVILKNPRSKTHQAFFFFCMSLIIWTFCYSRAYSSGTPEEANQWIRWAFWGIAFIPSTNFYFYSEMLGFQRKSWTVACFTLSAIFLSVHAETNLIHDGMQEFFWGPYAKAGSFYWSFIAFCAAVWGFGIKLVYKKMEEKKNIGDYIGYNQTKYIFLGLVGEGLAIIDFVPAYGVSFYPFGYVVALYWCGIVAFALTRYKMLMDISLHTRKVIIASAVLVVAVSYYLLALYLERILPFGPAFFLIAVSTTGGLLTGPLIRFTKEKIDQAFFPEFFQRKEKLARLGHEILRCKSSSEFNQIILDSLFNSFKITRTYLFIWSEEKKTFQIQSETLWGSFVVLHKTEELPANHPILKYLENKDYLLHDDVWRDYTLKLDHRAISLAMLEMNVSLCVPLRYDGKITGMFLFGDKESGLPYSKDEIEALNVLSSHAALAADNIDLNKRWTKEATHASQVDKILRTYMSSSVADEVLSHAGQSYGWKGEKRHATILMSDLRGFTHLAERYTPEEIVRTLNDYFSEMIETIMQNGGTVDKFMGDAILAVFGVPKSLADSEKAAVTCAIQMNEKLKNLNHRREEDNLFTLQMGIGIAAGDVVAGNIGSNKRMEYTVIGDAVNTASRLQSIATSGKIVVTNKILDRVIDFVKYNKLAPVAIKGKSQPMEIIEILGLKDDPNLSGEEDPDIIDLPLFRKLESK